MVIDALTIKDRHMRFKRHHSALGLPDITFVKSNMPIWWFLQNIILLFSLLKYNVMYGQGSKAVIAEG